MPDTGQSDGTWATYELGGTVDTGTVYPTQFGQVITHRAPYNSGFYTLTEGPGLGYILVYKTDVLTGVSSLLLQIGTINESNPANALYAKAIISSKDGLDILVTYADESQTTTYRRTSSDGGVTFSAPTVFALNFGELLVRLSATDLFLYAEDDDDPGAYTSNDLGITSSSRTGLGPPASHNLACEHYFAYFPERMSYVGWGSAVNIIRFAMSTEISVGVLTPLVNPSVPVLSFGAALFSGVLGTSPAVALNSPLESYWETDILTYLGGYPVNAFDCYGDPIDKSAGPLEGGVTPNSVVFNEDGTIGWYPIRTWDFLINSGGPVIPTGNQFFTAFQKTLETNFRP